MNHDRLPQLRPQLRQTGVGFVLALAAGVLSTAWAADTLQPLPDDPAASAAVGDGTTEITQKREQNAVTSVRVRRGDNTYYVTPAEQIPSSTGGGRAAQWEIFQFRPGRPKEIQAAPPPSLNR